MNVWVGWYIYDAYMQPHAYICIHVCVHQMALTMKIHLYWELRQIKAPLWEQCSQITWGELTTSLDAHSSCSRETHSHALLMRKQMGIVGICQCLTTPSLPLFQESHWWELTLETHLQVGRREVIPKILPSSTPCNYRHWNRAQM